MLLAAADESGAEVRPCFNVFEYIIEHGKVVGIHGRTPAGQTVLERATLVIGADGRNSGLARAVEAPIYNRVPTLLCYYFSYWSGVAAQEFELYIRTRERRVIFSFRTENDRFAVFVGAPIEEFETKRNEASAADYKENIAAARFTPFPPEFLAVRAAVRDKPGDATTLVKARMRMIEPSAFFNPNNMQRLLALAP